jgi:Ca2+-binding RTX toxin-like protein
MRAMKRAIAIATVVLCAQAVPVAHAAAEGALTVRLQGDSEANTFEIHLSADGRSYEIASVAPLEVGGGICVHPGGDMQQLVCEAPRISGFEVIGEVGDDVVEVGEEVPVPVTLSGGPGNDRLTGGGGDDELRGDAGFDRLSGGPGNDRISGGVGPDTISGGPGLDRLSGEEGLDVISGGPGDDRQAGGPGHDQLFGGSGNDWLNGGSGPDSIFGGPGDDTMIGGAEDTLVGGTGDNSVLPGPAR